MRKYKIIYADPAWNYDDQGCSGTMADHYHGMATDQIKALPIKQISDDDCTLFLWCTYPFLKQGIEVIEAWGFEYKTIAFQWLKSRKDGFGHFYGLGRWTRGNTEPCLLGVRGHPKRLAKDVFQLVYAPITRHSEKPKEVRDRIVRLVGDLPRIELFARQKVDGWDVWGNEVENSIELETEMEVRE